MTTYRGREVTGFAQDETAVDVELSDGQSLRAQYLVGCDGGRSLVRKAAGIEFPGWDPTTSSLIAEVELAEPPEEWGIRHDAVGMHALGRVEYEIRDGEIVYADSGPVGVMLTEAHVETASEPTLRDVTEALIAVYGTDYGIHSPTSDLQVHRYDPAGRGLPRQAGSAGRRRRTRAFTGWCTGPPVRRAGCGESGMEAGPGRQPDIAGQPPGLPTTPSVTRSPPACCAPRWRTSRSAARTNARRPCATPLPSSSWRTSSLARDSPR